MKEALNIKNIGISIADNGFLVTDITTKKSIIFTNSKKLRAWLKNNLSATGEVERFSNALDSEPTELLVEPYEKYTASWGSNV